MRESADGNGVHTLRGIVLDIFFGDATAGFDQYVVVEIPRAQLVDNGGHFRWRQIVEQQEARVVSLCLFTKTAELGGSCDSGGCTADFNFDKSGLGAHRPSAHNRFRGRLFFARRKERQVIVFDEYGVAKTDAVRPRSAKVGGALIKEAPRRFAGGYDTSLRTAARD